MLNRSVSRPLELGVVMLASSNRIEGERNQIGSCPWR